MDLSEESQELEADDVGESNKNEKPKNENSKSKNDKKNKKEEKKDKRDHGYFDNADQKEVKTTVTADTVSIDTYFQPFDRH